MLCRVTRKGYFLPLPLISLILNFMKTLHRQGILGLDKTRKETFTMMGFGFLFMLALIALPVILVVVLVSKLSGSK